jgi:hypothetical protein
MTMLNLKLYAPDFMENGAEAPKAKDIAKQHTFIMCPDSAKCLWHSDTRYHEPPYNAHPMDPTICRNAFDESCNPVDCVIH